jgi:hypothetical protein
MGSIEKLVPRRIEGMVSLQGFRGKARFASEHRLEHIFDRAIDMIADQRFGDFHGSRHEKGWISGDACPIGAFSHALNPE